MILTYVNFLYAKKSTLTLYMGTEISGILSCWIKDNAQNKWGRGTIFSEPTYRKMPHDYTYRGVVLTFGDAPLGISPSTLLSTETYVSGKN